MLMTRPLTLSVLSLVLLCGSATTLYGGHIPATCFANPLPSTPMAPVYTTLMGDLRAYMQVEVWRQPCTDSSGRIVPLMKITPKAAPPFVCSPAFSVIQAGNQYDVRLRRSVNAFPSPEPNNEAVLAAIHASAGTLCARVGHWRRRPPGYLAVFSTFAR
jgi:hypothetical protein